MVVLAAFAGLAGLLSAVGYCAYLVKLGSVAERRTGGAAVKEYIGTRLPLTCASVALSVLALLFVTGPTVANIVSICCGAVATVIALGAWQQTRDEYESYL